MDASALAAETPAADTGKPETTVKRTPGTGGVTDLWKKADGTPTKRATGRWAQGQGKPQGIGSRWRAWYVGDDGKQHTKDFRTEDEAKTWSNAERGKVVTNTWVNPNTGAVKFGAVAEQWFATKAARKPKTLAGYRSILDVIVLPKWRDTPMKEIAYADLTAWIAGLSVDGSQAQTALSGSRVRQVHQLMGAVFKYAVKAGLATKNIVADVERSELPKATKMKKHNYLTHAQLLDLASGTVRFEALTLVLGYCGLRFGEAAALRRKDIGNRAITVRASATHVAKRGIVESDTKTGETRTVPVPAPVWERLKAELPADPDAYVFPSRKGTVLPLGEYRWAFDNALEPLRTAATEERKTEPKGEETTPVFPYVTPHDLRHTCASLAISAGANVKVVQRMLGHATATMTLDLYGGLFSDDLAGVADALGKAITLTRKAA